MACKTPARKNLTDRAKRYRAQQNVTGPVKCAICGSTENLGVMHLDGIEDHGEPANLAWGCKSCNGILSAEFKRAGFGKPTNQYNPAKKEPPTYAQYAWAVSNHSRGSHDEGGAIIHATPKKLRIEYAKQIAVAAGRTKRERFDDRWNPAKGAFQKCVESVTKRGGAADPRAVCAAAGRKKYGQAEMTRRAVAGKKRAARNPSDDEAGRLAASFSSAARARALKEHIRYVEQVERGGRKLSVGELKVLKSRFRSGAKRNPAGLAADVFEEFHGYGPKELVTIEKRVHRHEHLAAAGQLVGLQVNPVGKGLPVRTIEGLGKKCFLAFNEAKNQLFVEGGDQALSWAELRRFGIRTEHELQTLGKLIGVGYYTDKTHLGDEGGEAIYSHTFRTTNENGVHIVVKIARYPDLIYRVLDEQLEVSGGDYLIRREGIDK